MLFLTFDGSSLYKTSDFRLPVSNVQPLGSKRCAGLLACLWIQRITKAAISTRILYRCRKAVNSIPSFHRPLAVLTEAQVSSQHLKCNRESILRPDCAISRRSLNVDTPLPVTAGGLNLGKEAAKGGIWSLASNRPIEHYPELSTFLPTM